MNRSLSENRASDQPGRHWVTRLGLAVGLFALVLLGSEGAVRIEEWIQWGTPISSGIRSVSDLSVTDRTGRHPAPGSSFRKWQINSLGTRGPEPDPTHGIPRVLLFGASETFGLYESPGQEYARQLADSLAASGCRADVLNAAFPGMSLPTVEQDLRLRLASTGAKVAIYYPTPPQYLDERPPIAVKLDPGGSGVLNVSPWRLRFAARARDAFKAMLPRAVQDYLRGRDIAHSRAQWPADSIFTTVPGDRLDLFGRDIKHLVGTMRAIGMTPVLVTHANAFIGTPPAAADRLRTWERFYPRATGATLVAFDSAANGRIRQVAADSAVALVDAWQGFHKHQADSMFADFSHFTNAGATRMASILLPQVSKALGCR